jgi:hypothetical protein
MIYIASKIDLAEGEEQPHAVPRTLNCFPGFKNIRKELINI